MEETTSANDNLRTFDHGVDVNPAKFEMRSDNLVIMGIESLLCRKGTPLHEVTMLTVPGKDSPVDIAFPSPGQSSLQVETSVVDSSIEAVIKEAIEHIGTVNAAEEDEVATSIIQIKVGMLLAN